MKRLFTLLLVCLLCLGMAACAKENKYAELNEMLDEGKYSEAITYILALQSEENGGLVLNGVVGDANTDTENESYSQLIGEWTISGGESNAPTTLVFNEDYTCNIDGKVMQWKANGSIFLILDGDTELYMLDFDECDTRELRLNLNVPEDSSNYTHCANYFHTDSVEAIQIDNSNWQEYFTFTEVANFGKNAFGETTSLSVSYRLVLKPKYLMRLSTAASSSGAVEIEYTQGDYQVVVDFTNKQYTLGSFTPSTQNPHKSTNSLENWDEYFGCSYSSPICSQSTLFYCPKDPQVLRIEATIYLVKE